MSHKSIKNNENIYGSYFTTEHKYFCSQKFNDPVPRPILTSIMCDLGPLNKEAEIIKRLIEAGMTIAKINIQSLDLEQAAKLIQKIRLAIGEVSKRYNFVYPLALTVALHVPIVTIGDLAVGPDKAVRLQEGCRVRLTQDAIWHNCGTELCLYIIGWDTIANLLTDDVIYIDSTNTTKIKLIVDQVDINYYDCTVVIGGFIANKMPVRVSHVPIDLNDNTDILSHQVRWAVGADVDAILLPNTRTVNDIDDIKSILKELGKKKLLVIAGIETALGISNLDSILEKADGVFFDRRSICNELPMEKLFVVQKIIAAKCHDVGKPFICQAVLNDQAPEVCVSDIANVVMDGVDVLYVEIDYHSGSTECIESQDLIRMAEHSIRAVKVICRQAETVTWKPFIYANLDLMGKSQFEFPVQIICLNAVELALRSKAVLLLCLTKGGRTAKLMSQAHSKLPIIAVTRVAETSRSLMFWKGCKPVLYIAQPKCVYEKEVEARIHSGLNFARKKGFLKTGDAHVVVYSSKKGIGHCDSFRLKYASNLSNILSLS